jgi:hypothetical protein
MKYERLCQALDIVSTDPLLSRLYLDCAIMPHLNQTEGRILEGIWHRSSRFGRKDPVLLSVDAYRIGAGPDYTKSFVIPTHRVSDRAFYKYIHNLRRLRLITTYKGNLSTITCYPRDFVDAKGSLINALDRDRERGEALIESIERLTEHFTKQAEHLIDRVGGIRPDLRLVQKVEEE